MAKTNTDLIKSGTYEEIKAKVEALPNLDLMIGEVSRKLNTGGTLSVEEKLVALYLSGRSGAGNISTRLREDLTESDVASKRESETTLGINPIRFNQETGLTEILNQSGEVIKQYQSGVNPETGELAQWDVTPPAAPGDEPQYLGGFPQGYSVNYQLPSTPYYKAGGLAPGPQKPGGPEYRLPDQTRTPQYLEYQNFAMFAGKDPVYLNQIQLTMYQAGVLDQEDMTPGGWWGEEEAKAMGQLMFEANINGTTWLEAAAARIAGGALEKKKQAARGAGPTAQPFVQEPYLIPDYDNLATAVRRTVSGTIGRQPEDWELALLAEKLNQDYRAQYEAETVANRAYHDAGNRALLSDTDQTSGEVQTVDPLSSLAEAVFQRYRQEIDFGERKEEHAYSVQRMMSNLAGIEQMVGGI